ncbi:hypothetical protein [Hymenobacter terricola]|uniref:hypothetical protein n=1 Tax=Hymenobacter terricola TaxID=2819236 RepID=UPI001B304BB7|nr:hypothetical protein [Hymenobacter terricola]
MAHAFQLDPGAQANARRGLLAQAVAERKGSRADFAPLYEDRWLIDTAVIGHLACIRGEWRVSLVFVHVHNPLRFIKRHITAHPTQARAAQQAYYMRRLAAKDQRGTLAVSVEQLRLSPN